MGTRADFYVGRGKNAEWLGSIAFDGYPDGIEPAVLNAKTEAKFRKNVAQFFKDCNHATLPDHGWPWPWDDSRTTDFSYAFDGKKVHASCFGSEWFDPLKKYTDDEIEARKKSADFPNMKDRQNVTFGKRSGLIVILDGDVVDDQ